MEMVEDMNAQNTLIRSVCLALLVLLLLCGIDLVRQGTHTGGVLAIFSPAWFAGIAGYMTFGLVVGSVLVVAMINPELICTRVMSRQRGLMGGWGWIGIALAVLLPAGLFLGPAGANITALHFRLLALSMSSLGVAALLPSDRYPFWKRLAYGAVLVAGVFGIALRFLYVTDFPFKLGWSEGNRLWDYSLYFRRATYDVQGSFPLPSYLTPGRHGLWGLPFLIPNVGIAVVRFWDALLWFVPALLLGYALFLSARNWTHRLNLVVFVFLTFLFVNQGPIYAPLLLSAAIIAYGVRPDKPVQSLLLTALACFYAGVSRWTWFIAPALWSGLVCLLQKAPEEDLSWWKRLLWPIGYGSAGLVGGLLALAATGHALFQGADNSSIAFSQPLLWYRLLPNATYPEGIILALLVAIGPLVGLILWALFTRRIHWDWLQLLGAAGILLATLVVGIIISVKIGGGNNLHNLDMFLISLLFIAANGYRAAAVQDTQPVAVSAVARLLFGLLVFIPAWGMLSAGSPLQLPDDQAVRLALRDINDIVYARSHEGEVLFLDQRQLLTFGEIENVPLVMEHELKDLTNRAMSGDPALFDAYYDDLETQRFSLIITGHLPQDYTAPGHPFGEEDNAQFEFIYAPMFAYYEVVRQFDDVGVWLLEPIEAPGE